MHYGRIIGGLEAVMAAQAGTIIAIVVDGGVLDRLFRYAARLPPARPRCYVTTNAGLSVFEYGNF